MKFPGLCQQNASYDKTKLQPACTFSTVETSWKLLSVPYYINTRTHHPSRSDTLSPTYVHSQSNIFIPNMEALFYKTLLKPPVICLRDIRGQPVFFFSKTKLAMVSHLMEAKTINTGVLLSSEIKDGKTGCYAHQKCCRKGRRCSPR